MEQLFGSQLSAVNLVAKSSRKRKEQLLNQQSFLSNSILQKRPIRNSSQPQVAYLVANSWRRLKKNLNRKSQLHRYSELKSLLLRCLEALTASQLPRYLEIQEPRLTNHCLVPPKHRCLCLELQQPLEVFLEQVLQAVFSKVHLYLAKKQKTRKNQVMKNKIKVKRVHLLTRIPTKSSSSKPSDKPFRRIHTPKSTKRRCLSSRS